MSGEEWVPEKGVLVARYFVDATSQVSFCFRDSDQDDQYCEICRIRDFVAEPGFNGFIESAQSIAQTNDCASAVIHRHLATWGELCAIKQLWRSKVPFDDWLQEVLELSGLADAEKECLKSASRMS